MGGKREAISHEILDNYFDFLSWCGQAGVVNQVQAKALREKVSMNPERAAMFLARAITLREAIYAIFFALIQGARPSTVDLDLLNSELSQGLGRLRLAPRTEGSGFEWQWSDQELELETPLGPIAYSAANLLISGEDLAHLHQCGGGNCGWLFLDHSKNHSRRWCDMRDCGNLAKVRRHRRKQQPPSGAGAQQHS